VVHAIGMDPNVENPSLSTLFGVDLERHGYIGRGNAYGNTAETSRPGVFVAGAATGPETIDDSIAQGHAAALAALGFLQPQRASA
jgi:heterodisulfide reductase subunit A